jgi:hypothetical protein
MNILDDIDSLIIQEGALKTIGKGGLIGVGVGGLLGGGIYKTLRDYFSDFKTQGIRSFEDAWSKMLGEDPELAREMATASIEDIEETKEIFRLIWEGESIKFIAHAAAEMGVVGAGIGLIVFLINKLVAKMKKR